MAGCGRSRAPEAAQQADLPPTVPRLEELTQADLELLDREKAVFILTCGNIEEHGPHLPVGSDYFRSIGIRNRLLPRLAAAYPDCRFILMPVVPLGEGGANDAAGQPDHIGTDAIRFETLRSVAIDLGAVRGFPTTSTNAAPVG